MDLIKAKEAAKTRSLDTKKKVYIDVVDEKPVLVGKQSDSSLFAYENGAEVPLERKVPKASKSSAQENKSINKTKDNMETKSAKTTTPAKKTATKEVAKKVVAKVAEKKKERVTVAKALVGKEQTMTGKQLRARVEAGELVLNTKGKSIPCTKIAERFPSRKFTVVTGAVKGVKAHQLTRGGAKE
jgi:hypothetical protein